MPLLIGTGPMNLAAGARVALPLVPTDGPGGTLAGRADKGVMLTSIVNGKVYVNTGTLSSPVWTVVGTQTY